MTVKKNTGKIKITKNGPYIVTGNVPLLKEVIVIGSDGEPESWKKELEYPKREKYALCRCGKSKNKPYCDRLHLKTNFTGDEKQNISNYMDDCEKTEGPEINLTFSDKFCASARFCHRAGDAWHLTENSNDPEAKKTVIEEAANCPSGSLITWDKNNNPIEPDFEPSISITEHPDGKTGGPIWVKGRIPIESADGKVYEIRNRVALCHCGKSKNKPFCNGTHTIR